MDPHPTPAAAGDPSPARPADGSASAPAPHLAETVERGSFCTARCACGWRGPARRSRDRAREDARAHHESPGD
ncbi:hypothetical protein ACN20G_11025 [Streptomyces sp. BI20]|uniref:hypothetical protein n=1 Tax=Streptomyces sp. BI20 TaxID=3403460 RepID=UPI003C7407DD